MRYLIPLPPEDFFAELEVLLCIYQRVNLRYDFLSAAHAEVFQRWYRREKVVTTPSGESVSISTSETDTGGNYIFVDGKMVRRPETLYAIPRLEFIASQFWDYPQLVFSQAAEFAEMPMSELEPNFVAWEESLHVAQ